MKLPPEIPRYIRFEGELLPKWAHLLDLAASLCPVSLKVCSWFFDFTRASGTENPKKVIEMCTALKEAIQVNGDLLTTQLSRGKDDANAKQIIAAWNYSLETMIQAASRKKVCTWSVEVNEDTSGTGPDSGDIELRRV